MSVHATQSLDLPKLASKPLPRRVRELLASVLKIVADDLERGLRATVTEFEQQLYRHGELAAANLVRDRWEHALEMVEQSRVDLLRHFLDALEAELANLQEPQVMRGHLQTRYRSGDALALVNDFEMEETSVLTDAATRTESQHSLPLFLLGQRFGVLAGRPAFDVETLPVGPQALCRSIRRAVERLGLEVEFRLMFYRAFDRQVMPGYGNLVQAINDQLARNGVLRTLHYVPVRARRAEQKPAAGTAAARGSSENADLLLAMSAANGRDLASEQGFQALRELMANRRQLLGKLHADHSSDLGETSRLVDNDDLQQALALLQERPAAPLLSYGKVTARNAVHLKQDLLAMLRRASPDQQAPMLSDAHSDALDLIGMLHDTLMQTVKPGSQTATLLSKLQVPLMRVALKDPGFFTQQEHPARQMLNAVAEAGVHGLGEDESDAGLVKQMHAIVDRAAHDYRGDPAVFKTALQNLNTHMQTLSRKAEVAERRHVEAARGKERLTLAREHAAKSVEALIQNQKLPRFTKTMLTQAWTDVMALTALRQGQDSLVWRRQLQVVQRLVEIAQDPPGDDDELSAEELSLQNDIEEGLSKVGYQGADVSAIAERLVRPNSTQKDDSSSRTELTMRLKARARLGEDLPSGKTRRMPLTSAEEVQLRRVQNVAAGTWFEFVINPQGDRVRRRLSWLSTATGDALFVNQRGQRNAEYTLDSLARLLAKGQVSIVEEEKSTILDQAWDNVVNALRAFGVPKPEQGQAP